jgi:hypothetical protein
MTHIDEPIVKPILVDHRYLWNTFRLGKGKLEQLVRDGDITVIRSHSKSRYVGKGAASRPRLFYVLKSVEDYFVKCAAKDGIDLKLN